MEKEIKYPLFLFENTHNGNRLGGQIEGIYNSIEELNVELEPWMVNENHFKAYDAQGMLLNLFTEWRKTKENSLFGICIVNREFIKVSIDSNPLVCSDLLKQFLKNKVQEILINIKNQSGILTVQTGFFYKRKVIDDKSVTIRLADNSYISVAFLKQAMSDFIKNVLTSDLTRIRDDLELPKLVELVKLLW